MEAADFLSRVAIFSKLERSKLEPLATKLRRRTFQRGEVIFHQGDPGRPAALLGRGDGEEFTHI